jgi:hypothetical protein
LLLRRGDFYAIGRRSKMKRNMAILGGIGVAAGLMYFLDPTAGRRRRAVVRDKMFSWTRRGRKAIDAAARDVGNRVQGTMTQMSGAGHGHVVDDPVLEGRIRSRIGHVVSRPSSIEVSVEEGRATLTGDVLDSEVNELMRTVADTPGVSSAENRLKTYTSAESIPVQQKAWRNSAMRPATWTPATWALMGITAGGIGASYAVRFMMTPRRKISFWARAFRPAVRIGVRIFRAAPVLSMHVIRSVAAYDMRRLRRWSPESLVLAGTAATALGYFGTRTAIEWSRPPSTWDRVKSAMPDMGAIGRMVPGIPAWAGRSISRWVH